MISQKAKYALRALISLAQAPKGAPLFISDIAEQQSIPKKFLEQILLDLKRHGILVSRRGKFGGYALARPPAEISFAEVIRIIDGPLALAPCVSRMAFKKCEACPDLKTCRLRQALLRARDATAAVLEQYSLADAVNGGATEILRPVA